MHRIREAFSRLMGRVPSFTLLLVLAAACDPGSGGPDTPDADTFDGLGQVDISGKVTYDFVPATYNPATERGTLAFSQLSEKPVRNAVVQLRQGSTVLATTSTDEEGNYQLSFTSNTPGTMSVAVLARTVSPPIQVQDNTDGDAIWGVSDILRAPTGTVDLHATHGWTGRAYDAAKRTAAPFAVLDSMYTAARAFMAVRTVDFPALKVNWSPDNVPQEGSKALGAIGTSHYAPNEEEIYILGKDGVDTDEFDSHVIVHEWGHFLEAQLSRSDSPGGEHSRGDVLDPRLAFSEGYGNALAAMVLPESVYADTLWGSTSRSWVAFGFDAEEPPSTTDDPRPGGFSEASVMRLLYDLYDANANEAHDRVGLGLGPLYDVLSGAQRTTSAMTTVASFIAALKHQPGVDEASVNTLLAHYQLGAITTEWGDGDTGLQGMYTRASALPYSGSATLTGGYLFNTRYQNQYFTFTGPGAGVTVSAASSDDVGIAVYLRGQLLTYADRYDTGGTETFTLATTQSGATYVVVLTGFRESSANYTASISMKSP